MLGDLEDEPRLAVLTLQGVEDRRETVLELHVHHCPDHGNDFALGSLFGGLALRSSLDVMPPLGCRGQGEVIAMSLKLVSVLEINSENTCRSCMGYRLVKITYLNPIKGLNLRHRVHFFIACMHHCTHTLVKILQSTMLRGPDT